MAASFDEPSEGNRCARAASSTREAVQSSQWVQRRHNREGTLLSSRGTLLKILGSLPGDIVLKSGSQNWRVDALIAALESDPPDADRHAYVLHHCSDGRYAIMRVEPSGDLSRTASYLEVR